MKNKFAIPDNPLQEEPRGFRRWIREKGYLLLCMAIPALLVYLIYLAREIHPFGDGCVMVLDLNGQYVWFFEALRNFVHGDGSLLYSFERALGGEFLGIYAYYIASPLSFLVCLFPKDRMLEALLTLFLIKTAICGGTFGYYMHRTARVRNRFAILIFSVFYAVSSYAIVQQHNTMWIDAMMWLPLITLGIEELIKKGKFRLYTLILAVTLWSNFYIGFMVCFYCAFYFILYYIGTSGKEGNPNRERLHFIKSLLRMGFWSLLAVGIAAVVLLGAYYSLNFGKTTFSVTKWEWSLNFDFEELLYKFLPGSYDTVRPEGYPFLYCGVLTLLLLPVYFLSKERTMKSKICAAVFVLVFIVSFSLSVLDLFWHGFQRPNWLNYRYSFMLCFYLCVLACRGFEDLETVSLKVPLAMSGLIGIFLVILQKYPDEKYMKPADFACIWLTAGCLFVHLCVLGAMRSATKRKQVACVVLVVACCIEVFVNGLLNMNALDSDVTYTHYSYYNNFLAKTRPIVEAVQEKDTSFYRMEKTFFRKVNDNMGLEMRGLSGSTSTLNQETIMFLDKMGYASLSHWSKYAGGTPVNDSLLGLKYIVSDQDIYANYYIPFESDIVNGYTAYRNPYALSIAYGVDDALLDFPLGYLGEEDPKKNDSETEKSKIGSAIEAVKGKINSLLDIDETVRRDTYTDKYSSPFERLNAIITSMLGEEKTVQVFVPIKTTDLTTANLERAWYADGHTCYNKTNSDKSASVTVTLDMPVNAELFFYQPTRYAREISLTLKNTTTGVSKSCGKFGTGENFRIVSLGNQTEGDELQLTMKLEAANLYYVTNAKWFYYIDWDVFEDVMARLASDQLEVTSYTEDSLNGTIRTSRDNETILTTIAYDKGWKITVDGQPVETVKALGSLVAFRIDGTAGEHTVRMVYRPNTLIIGAIVSGASLLLFLLFVILAHLMKKVPVLRSVVSIPLRKGMEEPEDTEEPGSPEDVPDVPDAPSPAPPADPTDSGEEPQKKKLNTVAVAGLSALGGAVLGAVAMMKQRKKANDDDDWED